MSGRGWLTGLVLVFTIAGDGCAGRASPRGAAVVPAPAPLTTVTGLASFYGRAFDGNLTASGVPFDMRALVAAHPTYPFGTRIRVINLRNDRSVEIEVIDRGPASGPQADGVIIDLSRGAAEALDFIEDGRTRVRLEILRWGTD